MIERHEEAKLFRQMLHQSTARFLSFGREGFLLKDNSPPKPNIIVRILNHGASRTLYRGRRPVCRSFDGIVSINAEKTHCQDCDDQKHCTPQVRVDLLVDATPYKILLAYTSAKNFLMFHSTVIQRQIEIYDVSVRIRVINRGSWGELRFEIVESSL